jgi:hypothetical protein
MHPIQTPTDPKLYDLHIYPTYAVHIPQRRSGSYKKSILALKNEENLKRNSNKGVLSAKARRRLINAVNWLAASASSKWIYDKSTKKRFYFKINFITLTLPTTDHTISDHYFKEKLLHNFINTCRYKFGLSNYVWKVEAQKNGNIHAHFTTDCFIHWRALRDVWNSILLKHGLIEPYRQKFAAMSEIDFLNFFAKSGIDQEILKKRYALGVRSKWLDPNTTDVKAVHKASEIGNYLSKYFAKNEADKRLISGRLWACSQSLAVSNKLVIECPPNENHDLFRELDKPHVSYKSIDVLDKVTGLARSVGEIFFYSLGDWNKNFIGALNQVFNIHCHNIRYSNQLFSSSRSYSDTLHPPEVMHITIDNLLITHTNQLNIF